MTENVQTASESTEQPSVQQPSADERLFRRADDEGIPPPKVMVRVFMATHLFASVRGAGHPCSPELIKQIVSETDQLLAELDATTV